MNEDFVNVFKKNISTCRVRFVREKHTSTCDVVFHHGAVPVLVETGLAFVWMPDLLSLTNYEGCVASGES